MQEQTAIGYTCTCTRNQNGGAFQMLQCLSGDSAADAVKVIGVKHQELVRKNEENLPLARLRAKAHGYCTW